MIIKKELMSNHTSLRVGGPAEYYVLANDKKSLIDIYTNSIRNRSQIFILGGGTNILVGDGGIKGVVINNRYKEFEISKNIPAKLVAERKIRNQQSRWREGILNWEGIMPVQSSEGVMVKVSSGYPLPLLISETLKKGITGLEVFAGIPGTIGGAIWNNIHGSNWFIGDFLEEVEVCDQFGNVFTIKKDKLDLEYNDSYFHSHSLLILSATLNLFLGNAIKARGISMEWINRKKVQPKNSAGSTFSNITEKERNSAGLDNLSAGYIIDKVLNLRGYTVGKAKISESHANFIEAYPGAKAADVVSIIDYVKGVTKEKLNINLIEEIVRVGEFI